MNKCVNIIGAGLAGCEAAHQLTKRGIKVNLYEMKALKKTPAQKSEYFAELVCSNSFRSADIGNAAGLLKEELRICDSFIMRIADETQVNSGSSLSVDRDEFSRKITDYIKNNPLITLIEDEVCEIPDGPTILASGPLTSDALSDSIKRFTEEEYLNFYDAISPIISKDSIDMTKCYIKNRWDKGEASYINCPFTKEEYISWYNTLVELERVETKPFEYKVFEACMPFEEMARRGIDTLRFGPMKPVGLHYGELKPYAVVQLREDNLSKTTYNIVGFQTKLKYDSQKKIIQMIPGLENAEIIRYGQMHRNTFICAPKVINSYYQSQKREDLFFAGQLAGVEGYIESIGSGLVASINMARYINGKSLLEFPKETSLGSSAYYISHSDPKLFEPMNTNYGIFPPLSDEIRDKHDRKDAYSKRAISRIKEFSHEFF